MDHIFWGAASLALLVLLVGLLIMMIADDVRSATGTTGSGARKRSSPAGELLL